MTESDNLVARTLDSIVYCFFRLFYPLGYLYGGMSNMVTLDKAVRLKRS